MRSFLYAANAVVKSFILFLRPGLWLGFLAKPLTFFGQTLAMSKWISQHPVKGLNDFFMVTLGTGVGSGIVANGKLIYGHDGFAGELGHMIAVRDGRVCGCGRKGCLETYASATGIVRTANEWLEREGVDSLLLAKKGNLTSRDIYYAANDGDALALDIFEFTAKILGQTLADAVTITSPQAIVFFGGLSFSGAFLMDPIRKYLEQNLLKIYKNKITILHSELPDSDAAILGASALAW